MYEGREGWRGYSDEGGEGKHFHFSPTHLLKELAAIP